MALGVACLTQAAPRLLPLFAGWNAAGKPPSDKPGGLNGSTQHLLEVCLPKVETGAK